MRYYEETNKVRIVELSRDELATLVKGGQLRTVGPEERMDDEMLLIRCLEESRE